MIDQVTSYSWFRSFRLQMCLESSVLFSYFRCLMEFMWLENRFLNTCSVRPVYMLDLLVLFFGVTFAL